MKSVSGSCPLADIACDLLLTRLMSSNLVVPPRTMKCHVRRKNVRLLARRKDKCRTQTAASG